MWSECRQVLSESEEVFGDLRKQVSNIIQYETLSSCIGLLFTRKSFSLSIHSLPFLHVCLCEHVCGVYSCVFVWTFTCGHVCRCQRRTLSSWCISLYPLPLRLGLSLPLDQGWQANKLQWSCCLWLPFQCWIYRRMCGLSTWLLGIHTQAFVYWASNSPSFFIRDCFTKSPFLLCHINTPVSFYNAFLGWILKDKGHQDALQVERIAWTN